MMRLRDVFPEERERIFLRLLKIYVFGFRLDKELQRTDKLLPRFFFHDDYQFNHDSFCQSQQSQIFHNEFLRPHELDLPPKPFLRILDEISTEAQSQYLIASDNSFKIEIQENFKAFSLKEFGQRKQYFEQNETFNQSQIKQILGQFCQLFEKIDNIVQKPLTPISEFQQLSTYLQQCKIWSIQKVILKTEIPQISKQTPQVSKYEDTQVVYEIPQLNQDNYELNSQLGDFGFKLFEISSDQRQIYKSFESNQIQSQRNETQSFQENSHALQNQPQIGEGSYEAHTNSNSSRTSSINSMQILQRYQGNTKNTQNRTSFQNSSTFHRHDGYSNFEQKPKYNLNRDLQVPNSKFDSLSNRKSNNSESIQSAPIVEIKRINNQDQDLIDSHKKVKNKRSKSMPNPIIKNQLLTNRQIKLRDSKLLDDTFRRHSYNLNILFQSKFIFTQSQQELYPQGNKGKMPISQHNNQLPEFFNSAHQLFPP